MTQIVHVTHMIALCEEYSEFFSLLKSNAVWCQMTSTTYFCCPFQSFDGKEDIWTTFMVLFLSFWILSDPILTAFHFRPGYFLKKKIIFCAPGKKKSHIGTA